MYLNSQKHIKLNIIHICERYFTSDAMSSKPRHCLSFSFCSRSHISGSSWDRLSWPVHGRSSSTIRVAAWDCWPRTLRRTGARWHSGCGQKRSCRDGGVREGIQRKEKDQLRVYSFYKDITVIRNPFSLDHCTKMSLMGTDISCQSLARFLLHPNLQILLFNQNLTTAQHITIALIIKVP